MYLPLRHSRVSAVCLFRLMALGLISLRMLMAFFGVLVMISFDTMKKGKDSPRTVKFFSEESTAPVPTVDTEDIEDASLSSPFPMTLPSKFEAVELDLFFFGISGRTFPGNSVRSFLCSLTKSPYRLPIKNSSSLFLFTRRINS